MGCLSTPIGLSTELDKVAQSRRCRNTQSDESVEISYTRSGDFDPHLATLVLEVIVLGCKTAFPTLAHAQIQAATLPSKTDYF